MKKKTQQADSTKNSNASAQNKPEKKSKKESKTSIEYPAWTMPEHLNEKDHKDLKRVYELYSEGKYELALCFTLDFDTIVREEIPPNVWKEIGGTLTPKEKKELLNNQGKMKEDENEFKADKQEKNLQEAVITVVEETPFTGEENEPKKEEANDVGNNNENVTSEPKRGNVIKPSFHFKHGFLLKEGKLFTFDNLTIEGNSQINEAKFYKKTDLEEFIIEHHKSFFGENTIIIDNPKSNNEYFPNMFLFDFNDREKPRMYVVEINVSDDSLGLLYARITHFIASLTNKKYQKDFLTELNNVINANDELKTELKNRLEEEQDISELLSNTLDNKPAILLLKDNVNVVLDLMHTVYIQTWGKMIRQILIKKFFCDDETIYDVNPLFADIWKSGIQKTQETVNVSENDHLCELPDRIRNIYRSIKTALLEVDSSLEFNPKKHYISIRKNKNLAFMHLRRKQADIVVMNPEESTRGLIKSHRIKSLPASVQKFWNGECCTIVVENSDNLEEVIELLKIIVLKVK